jgi:hypothetical protein
VTPAGEVTTIGGTAGVVGSADGAGSAAQFDRTYGIAVDPNGNLYVGDLGNQRISKGTLLAPPSITSQPQSGTNLAGENNIFTVAASGTQPLRYQWQANGTNLADNARVSGSQSNTLSISIVLPQDSGEYSVLVTNVFGSATSVVAVLTVDSAPRAATALATAANDDVALATITDGGWGYTNTPSVMVIGGGGSGAQAVAVVSNGVVVAVNILDPGAGYTNTPVLVIAPPFIPRPAMGISTMSPGPLATPVLELSVGRLSPYDNYQLEFAPTAGGAWTNLSSPFTPTSTTSTQYVPATGNMGFFRVRYVP